MTQESKLHWEKVYQTKQRTEVSWYRPHLEVSLEMIEAAASNRDARIIDVGAGQSSLVDDLLARDYRNLHVLDLSPTALTAASARLGADSANVEWHCGDVRTFPFDRHRYDVWHDRAVFHFLTDKEDRAAYVRQVVHAVNPGGHVVVATFGPQGPTKCSGLDVIRYDAEALRNEFGSAFRLVSHQDERHQTPMGSTQQFTYCHFTVLSDDAQVV